MEPSPQTPQPTSDVDIQRRFDEFQNEIRGEILSSRRKLVEWWLNAMGVGMTAAAGFLTAIALAAVILGYFTRQDFQQIEEEARQSMEATKGYAEEIERLFEEVRNLVEEIEGHRDVAEESSNQAVSITNSLSERSERLDEDTGARASAQGDSRLPPVERGRLIQAYNRLGNIEHDRGQHAEAIQYFEQAINMNPNIAALHNNLGTVKYDLGQYAEAASHFRKAIYLDDTYTFAYNNLGAALVDLGGQYQEAIQSLNKAIELDHTYGTPYLNIGKALAKLGRIKEARKACQKGLNLARASNNVELGERLEHLERILRSIDNSEEPGN